MSEKIPDVTQHDEQNFTIQAQLKSRPVTHKVALAVLFAVVGFVCVYLFLPELYLHGLSGLLPSDIIAAAMPWLAFTYLTTVLYIRFVLKYPWKAAFGFMRNLIDRAEEQSNKWDKSLWSKISGK